ncbi:hypothetical protein FIU85_14805 [Roseovarius sp. THAF8]|uniref:hypothetical protein n=1 Tax=Roseovarius sp. THAF8 TaxID=2587846 RepID=UPI0012A960A2|nr:hypothetical protein [Roseovarius sp. THAF8]QFT98583.1 hypothetical protein FIU85_14805 [Roseovarius sp. THAF8]
MRYVTICGHFGEWLHGRFGPSGQVALITLACSPLRVAAPSEEAFPFTDGRAVATKTGDLRSDAALASDSAPRCKARRGPCDPMADLARGLGTVGMVRAHTGSTRGLTFAPGTNPPCGPSELQEARLKTILSFDTGRA